METIFSFGSLTVMRFWLLIFLPHWRFTRRVMRSPLVIVPPALIYAALVLPGLAEVLAAVASPTLAGTAALLGTPEGATIGWLHFLAFDLFLGRWVYLDSRERGIGAWMMAPFLLVVLMLGPLGFILYLVVRTAHAAMQRGSATLPA